jgi:hypothetical protein
MRNAGPRILGVLLIAILHSGCAMMDVSREAMQSTLRVFKPRPNDYRDATQEEDDGWNNVGREARGNRPLEDESDWMSRFQSPKARAVERSLGYK